MENLLAGLGTEIRETLHSVMGMLELIREEPLSDSQSHYLTRCQAGADHLMAAANDVLELSRTEAPPYSPEPVALAAAVEEIASLMQLLAESRSQRLAWSFPDNLPHAIQGDRRLLQDTLRRLMASALDAAPGGSAQLSVRAEGAKLLFEVSRAAEGAERMGDFDSSLNLRIVRKRLGHWGGSLKSELQGGRIAICIELPFTEAASRPAVEEPRKSQVQPSGPVAPLNLLVVEDSDDSFYLLQAYVTGQGHSLSRAVDGAQAVEMAKTGRYDFVFMDVKMPVMDGYTASRLIREWETKEGRPRLPILLLSADEAARQMRLGADVGCSGFLAKPATRAQVLAALNFYARPAVLNSTE